jgi:hypothetical protein
MASSVLLSSLLMGILLIAIVVGILRFRQWRRGPDVADGTDLVERTLRSPATWTAVFVVIAIGLVLGVVAVVSGDSLPLPEDFWSLMTLFLAPFIVFLAFYLFAGVYSSARDRGLSSAPAVGLASAVLGFLLVAAIVVKLFTDAGG